MRTELLYQEIIGPQMWLLAHSDQSSESPESLLLQTVNEQ